MSTLNTYEFHLNGYRYALWPQWSNSDTRWQPYRQSMVSGEVETIGDSFTIKGGAFNALTAFVLNEREINK